MISIYLYVLSVILANFTAMQTFNIGPFIVAVGTLFFGATFTLRDYIHSRYGRHTIYKVITLVVCISIIQSLFLGVPIRIVVASAIAMAFSELADTEIYHTLRNRIWIIRVISSNAISVPTDTILFNCIAFLVFVSGVPMAQIGYTLLPLTALVSLVLTDILIKWGVATIIALPKTVLRKEIA